MRRHKILTSVVLAAWALAISCGGDDGGGPPPVNAPVVGTLSETVVSPGDTLIITGSNFSSNEAENTVTFWNPFSGTRPYQASTTELRVVVDQDATSGLISVTTEGGTDTGDYVEVQHAVGDVFVYTGIGNNKELLLPDPGSNQDHLVVPFSTNTALSPSLNVGYQLYSTSISLTAEKATAAAAAPPVPHGFPHEQFEAQRWENAQATLDRYGVPRGDFKRKPTVESVAEPPYRQFYVLKTTTGNQDLASSYQRITADLRYSGTKCLVYADVDTLSLGNNFAQSDFNTFGQEFDNSIATINVNAFGSYSDVDGNGKVILLISPVVNRLEEPGCSPGNCSCGFIAGFFNPRDLYNSPPVPSGTTNHAEILYLLAADPGGQWDCQFPVLETAAENLGTITHELEHLISFSQRVFNQGGAVQVTWLEEGMAHMAEDLNNDNSSNIGRGSLYRADPGAISIEDNAAGLEQRGGIYLMLRLLADRYGEGILKDIVQSTCTGRACIQTVSGKGFYDVFAEFLAAQYVSGKGITSDPRYNYASIDIDDFGALPVPNRPVGGTTVSGTVRRSAGEFHMFQNTGLENTIGFTDTGGQGKLRAVIVRTQ